jgi:hypothetical protein
VLLLPAALWCGGCDVAAPEPERGIGPDVHVVDMFPRDGCGGEDCVVPTNASFSLRFDRFLDPATVNRQAIFVYTGDREQGSPFTFQVRYDPVERVAEFVLGSGASFRPNTLYSYELAIAKQPGDFGIRAFDGAPLSEADIPLSGSFITGDEPSDVVEPPPSPSCDTVVDQVFGSLGQCAGSECHRRGGNQMLGTMEDLGDAPHSLWLDSPGNFAASAINRVARQTETGDVSGGVPAEQSPRFGVRLGLVLPRNPGASYLLYKLLLGPDNYTDCTSADQSELCALPGPCVTAYPSLPLAEGECLEAPTEELSRLREWFVRGVAMPRKNSLGQKGNVHIQGMRALSAFIAAGASCED